MLKNILLPLLLLICASCGSKFEATETPNPQQDPQHDLQQAKTQWSAMKERIGSYTLIRDNITCFGYGEIYSSVTNTGVVSNCLHRFYEWGLQSFTETDCPLSDGATTEDLFQKIEEGLKEGLKVEVTYNKNYGVPTKIWIDYPPQDPEFADVIPGYYTEIKFEFLTP